MKLARRRNPLTSRGNWIAGGLAVGGVAAAAGGTALFAGNFMCGFMNGGSNNPGCSGANAKAGIGAALMIGGVMATGAGLGGLIGGQWNRPVLGGTIGAIGLPLLIAIGGRLNGGSSKPAPAQAAPGAGKHAVSEGTKIFDESWPIQLHTQ